MKRAFRFNSSDDVCRNEEAYYYSYTSLGLDYYNDYYDNCRKYDDYYKNFYDTYYDHGYINLPISFYKPYHEYSTFSYTTNYALGYGTTNHPLLDLNYMVTSLRSFYPSDLAYAFSIAYRSDPTHTLKWLFYLRDILEGLGERKSFRIFLSELIQIEPTIARAIMPLIPFYGRFDDLFVYLSTSLEDAMCAYLKKRLRKDTIAKEKGEPISLLAKWLPSTNASSKKTIRMGYKFAEKFGMTAKEYRKTLSDLRAYLNVVEIKMSSNDWANIDYKTVPAIANLKYEKAFERHDRDRRLAFLTESINELNTSSLCPYHITNRMKDSHRWFLRYKNDLFSEVLWKKLMKTGYSNYPNLKDCIVVADRSSRGMDSPISPGSPITALDVCHSLAIYYAEQLKGVFQNKVIVSGYPPRFINLKKGHSLMQKLNLLMTDSRPGGFNIEQIFTFILETAKSNHSTASEVPKSILIISDMEFEMATYDSTLARLYQRMGITPLFETIEARFKEAGYELPQLIFWNVCSGSNTIPMVRNKNGLCLISGFSQNTIKAADSKDITDPYESLLKFLDGPRYKKVEQTIAPLLSQKTS